MTKILLDHSDGRYSTRHLSDEEAAAFEDQGGEVAHVEDHVLEAWHRHCEQEGVWQTLWRVIDNERYVRRRERELLPLEDADREIARLKDELARAKRLELFYEEQYARQLGERHREEYVEFTCIFPQPGCQIDALPPEWRDHAEELLEQYSVKHAAEGMKVQGCCCGHTHKKLDEATTAQLREAGFIVEHDVERA
jgi:hypothetical protein